MSVYDQLAINDIRSYLWDNLKSSSLFVESDYYADGFTQPIIPIIPAQQVPELNNLLPGKTFIVYDYEILPIRHDWWIVDEMALFAVNSIRQDEINSIMNFMVDLFRRYDDSALEIRNSNIISNNFIFHYTAIESIKSPEPSKLEGGVKTGYVNLFYSYSRKTTNGDRF